MNNIIISNTVFRILPSATLAFSEKALKLKKKGVNVINFAEGNLILIPQII